MAGGAEMAAIGVLTLELRIDHAHSLKDKRQVVRSLVERLRGRFNVSVAEVGYQELWQRALLAAVTVASARVPAESVLQRVEREAAEQVGGMLVSAGIEWIE
jgi:uncharacterized protein